MIAGITIAAGLVAIAAAIGPVGWIGLAVLAAWLWRTG